MNWNLIWDQLMTSLFDANSRFWSWMNQHFSKWIGDHLGNIILILFISWLVRRFGSKFALRIVGRTVRKDLYPTEIDRRKRIKTLESLVNAIFNAGTWGVALLLIISELRPSYAGALFASAGVVGLALGFGAQSLIKDFVSGIFIITENQFRVGDVVTLNSVSGKVEGITMRTTVLRDDDGSVHHIPNGIITITTNHTLDYSRLHETIVVAGENKVEAVEKLIDKVGAQLASDPLTERYIKEPPHVAKVLGLTNNGELVVQISAKMSAVHRAKVRSEFYRLLNKEAVKQKISLKAAK